MKGNIVFIVGVCLMSCLHATDKPKPFETDPKKLIANVVEECASNPSPVKCQAYQLLHTSDNRVQLAKATVSIDVFGVQYEHKSRTTVHKEVAAQKLEFQKSVWPLLDHAQTLALPTEALDAIKSYRSLTAACMANLDLIKNDVIDEYSARMDSCTIPSQEQLDKAYVRLGYAAVNPPVGFRKSHWGDSKAAVESIEGKPVATPEGELAYRVTLDGHNAFAVFYFTQNKLVTGVYQFNDEHSDNNAFIEDYDAISGVLTSKYGKPSSHDATWSDTLFKNDPTHWGMAVSAGHVIFSELWGPSDTNIFHALTGDNFKVEHTIRYSSIQYKLLLDQQEKEHASDGF